MLRSRWYPRPVFIPRLLRTKGGYTKTSGTGADLNFMVLHKDALIQYEKHVAPKIVTPEQNQTADAWKFGYRNVGIAQVYKNKAAGIYASHKTAG